MPADNETPLPAPPSPGVCRFAANIIRDGWDCIIHGGFVRGDDLNLPTARCDDPESSACPGIAAPQQSAGAWKMTEDQSEAVVAEVLRMHRLGFDRFSWARPVEAAVRLGIVNPCIVRGSRDHDLKESAGAISDFDGEATQEPEDGIDAQGNIIAGWCAVCWEPNSCPHGHSDEEWTAATNRRIAQRRAELASRDAGLDLDDAIMARAKSMRAAAALAPTRAASEMHEYAADTLLALVAECRRLRAALANVEAAFDEAERRMASHDGARIVRELRASSQRSDAGADA